MNINYALIVKLESISNDIREILEIPSDKIINSDYLETLIKKIHENFENYKIEKGYDMQFTLKDGDKITITYDMDKNTDDQIFEFVIRAFCYGILMNKEKLNKHQLHSYSIKESVILNDKYAVCLSRMLMMPKNLYMKEMVNFSTNDGSVDTKGMQRKLKIKDSDIISRGIDLNIW